MPNINDYGLPFTSQDGDRKYSALEWREYFSRLIHNGLIQNAANECQVKPQAVPNKTVYVDTGVVFINGAMRVLDAPVTLAVAENTSGNPRIDRVVARLNEASRTIEFAVKQGTPAGSPVAPALTRAGGVYELGLADISLANGFSTITENEIYDLRSDAVLCGASSMTIGVIPPKGSDAVTIQLQPETQALYGVENVDDALMVASPFDYPLSSYIAFTGNVNASSLCSAFVPCKPNELSNKNVALGYQIYRHLTEFSSATLTDEQKDLLISCNDWYECCSHTELRNLFNANASFLEKINSVPFAKLFLNTYVGVTYQSALETVNTVLGKEYSSFRDILKNSADMHTMLNSQVCSTAMQNCGLAYYELFSLKNAFVSTGVSGNFTVPNDVKVLNYEIIGRGNPGKYLVGSMMVTPGQVIPYSSPTYGTTVGETTLGSLTTANGQPIGDINVLGIFARGKNGTPPGGTPTGEQSKGGIGPGSGGGGPDNYNSANAGAGGGGGFGAGCGNAYSNVNPGGSGGEGFALEPGTRTSGVKFLPDTLMNNLRYHYLSEVFAYYNAFGGAGGGNRSTNGGGSGAGGAPKGSHANGAVILFWEY